MSVRQRLLGRCAIAVGLLAVGAFAAPTATRAQDEEPEGPLYDVEALASKGGAGDTAGDIVTVEASRSSNTTMIATRPDGQTSENENVERLEYRYVERHDGHDDDGVWTRTIHLTDWTSEAAGSADRSLAGSTLRVTGASWERLAGDDELSKAALDWIEEELLDDADAGGDDTEAESEESADDADDDDGPNAFGDLFKSALMPGEPVPVGAEWVLDPDGLGEALGKKWSESMTCSEHRGTGRLVRVDGGDEPTALSIEFTIDVEVEGISARGHTFPAAPGSAISMSIVGDGPVGEHAGPSEFVVKAEIDIEISVPGGATAFVQGGMEWSKSETPGGELPELPATDDE